MYTSIEIDFDVFKELTIRRKTPEMTENDVIRELLFGPASSKPIRSQESEQNPTGKPWVSKGVIFPHGTEFRANYWGQLHYAQVEDGALVYEGKRYKSPSPAASAITETSINGWSFWECKKPGDNKWVHISKLRND